MLESIPLACVRARSHLGVGLVALLDLRQSLRLGDRLIVGGFGFTSPATTFTAGRRRWWWWRRQRVRRWRRVCGVAVVAVAVAAAAALWRPALPVDQGRCSLQDGKYLRRPPPEILARLANARATELEFSAAAAAAQPTIAGSTRAVGSVAGLENFHKLRLKKQAISSSAWRWHRPTMPWRWPEPAVHTARPKPTAAARCRSARSTDRSRGRNDVKKRRETNAGAYAIKLRDVVEVVAISFVATFVPPLG